MILIARHGVLIVTTLAKTVPVRADALDALIDRKIAQVYWW